VLYRHALCVYSTRMRIIDKKQLPKNLWRKNTYHIINIILNTHACWIYTHACWTYTYTCCIDTQCGTVTIPCCKLIRDTCSWHLRFMYTLQYSNSIHSVSKSHVTYQNHTFHIKIIIMRVIITRISVIIKRISAITRMSVIITHSVSKSYLTSQNHTHASGIAASQNSIWIFLVVLWKF
jgi:hypothetical protein